MDALYGIKLNSQPVRNKKNRENTRQRKTIIRIRKYLRDSAICLPLRSCRDFTITREELQVAATIFFFFLSIKHDNNTTLKKNPNYKRRFHNGLNGPKIFSWGCCPRTPKRLVHERSGLGLSAQASAP